MLGVFLVPSGEGEHYAYNGNQCDHLSTDHEAELNKLLVEDLLSISFAVYFGWEKISRE